MILGSDPLICGPLAAGKTSPATTGVAQVFDVGAVFVGSGVLLNAQDRCAARQHSDHRLNFDITQTASVHQVRQAPIRREQFFSGRG